MERLRNSREGRSPSNSAAARLYRTDKRVCGRFRVNRRGPSRRRGLGAPAVLKNFVRHPNETFSTASAKSGPKSDSPRRANQSFYFAIGAAPAGAGWTENRGARSCQTRMRGVPICWKSQNATTTSRRTMERLGAFLYLRSVSAARRRSLFGMTCFALQSPPVNRRSREPALVTHSGRVAP